jgi:hypothetical protein
VLVELWEKNRRVRTQAALTALYERRMAAAVERIERALELLKDADPDTRVLLEQAADDLQA